MEYLTQWEFWQEVGLTVAARLSVVAVALWAVKMVTDHLGERPAAKTGSRRLLAPALPKITRTSRERHGGKTRGSYPAEVRHRPLTLKKPGPDSWREKMGKYLSGEPIASPNVHRPQK